MTFVPRTSDPDRDHLEERSPSRSRNGSRRREQDKRGLVDILREEFGVPRDVLQYQVAQFYAFRVVGPSDRSTRRLTGADVNRLIKGLPEPIRQLAIRFKVLPYDVAENQPDKVIVVTPNPSDREVSEVVRALPYKKFEICYMKESDWTDYWRQVTSDKPLPEARRRKHGRHDTGDRKQILKEHWTGTSAAASWVALVENVLADAVRVDATDIHFVPRNARKTDVFFRIDGTLSLWYSIDEARTEAVVAVVKARSLSMDRYERMAAQEGSTQKVIDGKTVRFRVSSIAVVDRDPSVQYEALALQVLQDKEIPARLDTIGLDPYSLDVFKEALALPQGLVDLHRIAGKRPEHHADRRAAVGHEADAQYRHRGGSGRVHPRRGPPGEADAQAQFRRRAPRDPAPRSRYRHARVRSPTGPPRRSRCGLRRPATESSPSCTRTIRWEHSSGCWAWAWSRIFSCTASR